MAKKQAKITKLKEDTLFSNGSNDTVFPVTVGEAVGVKMGTKDENLNTALNKLQGTKCGWFYTRIVENPDTGVNYYHLLGFSTKETCAAWKETQNDSLIIIDIITGEVDTVGGSDPEEPEEPPTPPEDTTKLLISPRESDGVVYSDSNPIILKGQNLQNAIYISSDDFKFVFKGQFPNNPALPNTHATIIAMAVQDYVCSDDGLPISVALSSAEAVNNSNDSIITGKIHIKSADLVNPEFETVTVDGACANNPKLLSPQKNLVLDLSSNDVA